MRSAFAAPAARSRRLPDLTLDFWLLTLLTVTAGQTLADQLSLHWQIGEAGAAAIVIPLFTAAVAVQLAQKRYRPWAYWTAVVIASVAGTLISDVLVVTCGIGPAITAPLFAILLGGIFAVWRRSERILSIPTARTMQSELLYWLAVISSFSLGTSVDDWLSERVGLGYLVSSLVFIEAFALIACSYVVLQTRGALHFWAACIAMRCGGASLGNYMIHPRQIGGLGMGTAGSSVVLLFGIAIVVLIASLDDGTGRLIKRTSQ
jgi:uncharacterized membrane-anchored protein